MDSSMGMFSDSAMLASHSSCPNFTGLDVGPDFSGLEQQQHQQDLEPQPGPPRSLPPIHLLPNGHEPNMCDDFFGLGFLDPNFLPSPPGFLKSWHDAIMSLGEHRD